MAGCWRCRLLNMACDSETSCSACEKSLQQEQNQAQVSCCQPQELIADLEDAISDLVEISDTVWFFRLNDEVYEVCVDMTTLGMENAYKDVILDLPYMIKRNHDQANEDRSMSLFAATCDFYSQFSEVATRWSLEYEPWTNDIIRLSAQYATKLLGSQPINGSEPKLQDNVHSGAERGQVAMLAVMRCLCISNFLADFALNNLGTDSPDPTFKENFDVEGEYIFSETSLDVSTGQHLYTRLRPDVRLVCRVRDFVLPSSEMPIHSTLCFLLQQAISGAEELLLSRSPQHWPAVFCILAFLVLVHANLDYLHDYIHTAKPAEETLAKAIMRLSRLFLFCCSDLHPLSYTFDLEWFGLSVGGDAAAIELYRDLRNVCEQWLHNTDAYEPDDPYEPDGYSAEEFAALLHELLLSR